MRRSKVEGQEIQVSVLRVVHGSGLERRVGSEIMQLPLQLHLATANLDELAF